MIRCIVNIYDRYIIPGLPDSAIWRSPNREREKRVNDIVRGLAGDIKKEFRREAKAVLAELDEFKISFDELPFDEWIEVCSSLGTTSIMKKKGGWLIKRETSGGNVEIVERDVLLASSETSGFGHLLSTRDVESYIVRLLADALHKKIVEYL